MRPRYVELLARRAEDRADARPNYLADIDSGFYVIVVPALVGVRGAAARVPAREVRHRVVRAREAGSLLRELWSEGQRINATRS